MVVFYWNATLEAASEVLSTAYTTVTLVELQGLPLTLNRSMHAMLLGNVKHETQKMVTSDLAGIGMFRMKQDMQRIITNKTDFINFSKEAPSLFGIFDKIRYWF